MKAVLNVLGGGAAVVAILFVCFAVFSFVSVKKSDESFLPFIEDTIPQLTTWELEPYRELMEKKAFENVSSEQWQLLLKKFATLGQLRTVGTPQRKKATTTSGTSGTQTIARYLVPLEFDTGEAHVSLVLVVRDGVIKVRGVRFLSDLLLR